MSSVVISGDTSGAVTLAAPAVAGTTTLTLPATTGTVLNDATVGVCRAWVNFNGTGTVAIRASFNVTNITDSGVGEYVVNFTNAMSDANYSAVANDNFSTNPHIIRAFSYATNSISIQVFQPGVSGYDPNTVSVAVFR